MTVVLPGDVVPIASSSAIKLGPGMLPTPSQQQQLLESSTASTTPSLTAIRSGALGQIAPAGSGSLAKKKDSDSTAFWVETNTNRYVPSPSDPVIAQITNRGAESYTLSLFSAHSATLPALSFEGATKRHKPNLRIGALVYARIVSADRFTEPELTCVNPVTGKSDGFGDLKTTDERGEKSGVAMLFRISIGLARSLLRPTHGLLKLVANHFPFEAAVGANGVVWVRANEVKHVIAVGKVLELADQSITRHDSSAATANDEQDEAEEDDEEDGRVLDADYIVKNRAVGRLDAKKVRTIVQEYL